MTQSPPTVPIRLPAGAQRRARRFWLLAATSGLAYVVLTVAVKLGLLDGVDDRLAQLGRPDDGWGTRQQLFSHVTSDFGPAHVGDALITLLLLVLVVRRQWRLVGLAGLVAWVAGFAAAATKVLIARPDVQGNLGTLSSYPSGHAVSATVCAGLALLLMWPAPRWWHLTLPVVPGLVMGVSVVVIGMHWASDAVGGVLLGVTGLAAAAGWQCLTGRHAAPS